MQGAGEWRRVGGRAVGSGGKENEAPMARSWEESGELSSGHEADGRQVAIETGLSEFGDDRFCG